METLKKCRCGKTDDNPTAVKERLTGEVFNLCVDCLVDFCLAGAMMHPDPRYEYHNVKES